MALTPTVAVKAGAALLLLALGLCLAWTARRARPHGFLAAFVLLLAGNMGAEAMRGLAGDGALSLTWWRVATVFAALDPLFLYYFASLHPHRNRLQDALPLVLVAVPAAVFAFATPILAPGDHVPTLGLVAGLSLYTLAVYSVVLRKWLSDAQATYSMRILALALLLAWFPTVIRGADDLDHFWQWTVGPLYRPPWANLLVSIVVPFVVGTLLALWWSRRLRPVPRVAVAAAFALAMVIFARPILFYAYGTVGWDLAALDPVDPFLEALGSASAAIRWIVFALLATAALLRFGLAPLEPWERRVFARLVLGAAFAGAALLLVVAISQGGTALGPLEWGAIVLAFASSQVSQRTLDLVAERAFGVPRPSAAPESAVLGGLLPGATFAGRYEVARRLGTGSGGTAFLATDRLLRRDVALKAIPGTRAVAAIKEARLAGSIRHENVITLYDVVSAGDVTVLVFEHAPRGTLAEALEEGPLPPDEALRVLLGVTRGMAAAHARGVVHRDLKPANVLLAEEGPKVADFGIARLLGSATWDEGEAPGALRGTPGYIAPEVLAGEVATAASDVYGIGALARAMGTEWPPEVAAVVARALAASPQERWPDAGAMLRALADAAPLRS